MFIVSSEPLSADDDNNVIPSEYYLEQNYPNPFNPSTTISWQMPVGGKVKLIVLDILGRPVAELVNEFRPAGSYQVEFSAKAGSASGGNAYVLPSGIYFYQLSVGDEFLETKKLVLMK
jgi:hypothetical protein